MKNYLVFFQLYCCVIRNFIAILSGLLFLLFSAEAYAQITESAPLPFDHQAGSASCYLRYHANPESEPGFISVILETRPANVIPVGDDQIASCYYKACNSNYTQPGHCQEIAAFGGSDYQKRCLTGYHDNSGGNGRCLRDLNSTFSILAKNTLNEGCPASNVLTGNPIHIQLGNKFQLETDYTFSTLKLRRDYNSYSENASPIVGNKWLHYYNKSLKSITSPTVKTAVIYRDNSQFILFNFNGSTWESDEDVNDKLSEFKDAGGTTTGWQYSIDLTGEVESYDVNGALLSVSDRAGVLQTMVYSNASTPVNIALVPGLLVQVFDSFGRSLNFTYDNVNRIASVTNPAGGVYTYTYGTDSYNNLVSVTYPDGKVRTYLYENTSYPNALTGIVDENLNRYATWSYDNSGKAVSSEHAGGVEKYLVSVNGDGSKSVTDPLGASRTYNFTTILGVVKSTGQSQPSGSGCAASAAALSYDANGNISSRTDFNGNLTTYSYDMTRNLETSRTEGLTLTAAGTATTPATGTANSTTRTITTSYHPTWRLPLTISEYSGGSTSGGTPAGTLLKTTTDVYDSHGNITSIAVNDAGRALTRTTNIAYTYSTAVPGLVLTKVVDGPRTDVSDITTYTYYPHDAACTPSNATPIVNPVTSLTPDNLGCRGQLMSMTNALNQTTTYDRYNHHGQVEQMTDANGLVTTNTYDLRQRLLSRTVSNASIGSQTTSLTYDGVGQVTQLSMPDNSMLNYTYDAAHRLTDVQDTLGNKVHYSLDSEGNRINETTTDPLGTLAKTLSRSYDQLSRLQTLTGLE